VPLLERKTLLAILTGVFVLVLAPAALAALAKGDHSKQPGLLEAPVFNGLDSNPVLARTFRAHIGDPRVANDYCGVLEHRALREFTFDPFGLRDGSPNPLFLLENRRPKISIQRWGSNPNLSPGLKPETLRVEKLRATRGAKGNPMYWSAEVALPPGVPSYLVVRASWRDPDDCAAGPDWIASGIAFTAHGSQKHLGSGTRAFSPLPHGLGLWPRGLQKLDP
jgi:hypothetical protein